MNAKNISRAAAVAGLFLLSALALRQGTEAQASLSRLPAALAQPMPPTLQPLSLLGALGDARAATADWNYIQALQYIGDKLNVNDANFTKTFGLYRTVLWLDPYFHFAVLEGASVLAWANEDYAGGRRLLEEAMRVDPKFERYRLYYAALAYAARGVTRENHVQMLELLKHEIQKPDAPEMLLRQVGNIMTLYAKPSEALAYWRGLLYRAKERQTMDLARQEMGKLESKVKN